MNNTKDEKKKRVNSKSKGSGNERAIAKLLSEKLSPLQFRKSESSGAIVGGKNFFTQGRKFSNSSLTLFVGDVVPLNEDEVRQTFKFVIEAKHYRDVEKMHRLFDNSIIYKWMEEVRIDAAKIEGKEPILIFKWNNTPFMVGLNDNTTLPEQISNVICISKHHINLLLLEDLLQYPDFWINKVI